MSADQGEVGRDTRIRRRNVLQVVEGRVDLTRHHLSQSQRGALLGVLGVFFRGLGKVVFRLFEITALQIRFAGHRKQFGVNVRLVQARQQGGHGLTGLPRTQVSGGQHAPRQRQLRRKLQRLAQVHLRLHSGIELQLHHTSELQTLHIVRCRFQHLLRQLSRQREVFALKRPLRFQVLGLRVIGGKFLDGGYLVFSLWQFALLQQDRCHGRVTRQKISFDINRLLVGGQGFIGLIFGVQKNVALELPGLKALRGFRDNFFSNRQGTIKVTLSRFLARLQDLGRRMRRVCLQSSFQG